MNNNPATSLPHPTDIAALLSRPHGSTLRYCGVPNPTGAFWLAALVALGLHAAMLWGFNRHPVAVRIVPPKDIIDIVEWTPVPDDPPAPKPREFNNDRPEVSVPSLADLPKPVTIETVFVQTPDPYVPLKNDGKEGLVSIPINFRHGSLEGGDTPGVFKPSELDRVPEPVVQTQPDYPFELKRSGIDGRVRVGFIVDSHANVVSPYIISSTNKGFERATIDALAKWKFRPGMKNGRKVNTRMEQPIDFNMQL